MCSHRDAVVVSVPAALSTISRCLVYRRTRLAVLSHESESSRVCRSSQLPSEPVAKRLVGWLAGWLAGPLVKSDRINFCGLIIRCYLNGSNRSHEIAESLQNQDENTWRNVASRCFERALIVTLNLNSSLRG